MSLPFLLEIGAEEIPDWMIPGALESLHLLFEKTGIAHETVRLDATPRRLVINELCKPQLGPKPRFCQRRYQKVQLRIWCEAQGELA